MVIKNNSQIQIIKDIKTLNNIGNISEELVWLQNFPSKFTKQTYKDAVSKFCNLFEIRNIDDLRNVQSIHIIKFRDDMKESGEKNATINNRLSALSSLFKHLIEKQLMNINPVYGVKTMKKDYTKVKSRALSNMEVNAMLEAPDTNKLIGLRDKAMLSIMFNIGTRVGTISNLTGKDIFEEAGYLVFDMHLKGDKRNKVAVNSHIQANLRNYFEAIGYYKKNSDGNIKFDIPHKSPIFPMMSYNPKNYDFNRKMSTTSIYRMWQKYALKAGLVRTNPHCARATFITKALSTGCDLQYVQHTAGHNDPRTTKSYDHSEIDYKNSASFSVSFG